MNLNLRLWADTTILEKAGNNRSPTIPNSPNVVKTFENSDLLFKETKTKKIMILITIVSIYGRGKAFKNANFFKFW